MSTRLHAPFVRIALGFYVLALSLGVLLRISFVHPLPGLQFTFAVHAHSHTLYFGWAGLTVVALALRSVGASGRFPRWVLTSLTLLAAATFGVFLHSGYSPLGIAVSALSLPVWLCAGVAWFRAARGHRELGTTFLQVGFVYGGLAMLGAVARVVLLAVQVSDPVYGRLAVFAFLHNFAWFFLFAVTGLLVRHLVSRGTAVDERLLRWTLRLAAPAAWLTFPLGVAGATEGVLGVLARLALVPVAASGAVLAVALWRAADGDWPLRWLSGWAATKAVLDVAGVLGLASLAASARHPAILYLHVELVGFVTGGLLLVTSARGRGSLALHWGHHLGLAVMVLGLGLTSLVAMGLLPPEGWMRLSLWLAVAGGAAILLAGLGFAIAGPRREAATLRAHGVQVASRRAAAQGQGD